MEYRQLGSSGMRPSVIGLGAWQWGSKRYWSYGKSYGEKEISEILDEALERGVNLIDTAEIYGWGESERLLGKLLPDREEVIIATKYWPFRLGADSVFKAVEKSLKRLDTDVIDLYQIHWPPYLCSTRRLMKNMEKLVNGGKIGHIGVSNFSIKHLKEAQSALSTCRIVSNQVRYNVINRDPERNGLIEYCRDNDIGIIAWSPLEQGLLTEKFLGGGEVTGFRRLRPAFWRWNVRRVQPVLESLKTCSQNHEKTTAQGALNWLIDDDNVWVIPGASRGEQVRDNCGASGWRFNEKELERIEKSYQDYKK